VDAGGGIDLNMHGTALARMVVRKTSARSLIFFSGLQKGASGNPRGHRRTPVTRRPVTSIALISTRHEYGWLFGIYVPIAAGVFAVICVVVLGAVLRYRRRAVQDASRVSERNSLEAGYAALLTATVAFLLYLTFTAEHRVDTVSLRQTPALTVNVIGAKWEWEFRYPRYGIVRRSGTVGRQPLVVPVNRPVRFTLSAQDVIHAFWVSELRFKRDLIPGRTQTVVLTFTRTGLFRGQCAEFCGLRHSEMVFNVRVLPPASFARWAASGGRLGI
jgi:cytochrome c oxidase subunit 2